MKTSERAIDPYHELRHLHLRGRLLHPMSLKTGRIELPFLPSKDLDPEVRKALREFLVGLLDGYGDALTGLISLPEDALPPILQMMIGEDIMPQRRGRR